MKLFQLFTISILLSLCTVSCTSASNAPTAVSISFSTPSLVQYTPAPTITRSVKQIPTQTATLIPTILPMDCEVSTELTRYEVVANLNYADKLLSIAQLVTFTNHTEESLTSIVFDIQPNQIKDVLSLDQILVGGQIVDYELNGTRLDLILPFELEPLCSIEIQLAYRLTIPKISEGITSFRGYFGHTIRQLNMGNWLAAIVPHLNGDWLIHAPLNIGEQIVLDLADWDISLNVSNAPDNLILAAPGQVEIIDQNRWHIIHNASREVALSLSPHFTVKTASTRSGKIVEAYTLPDAISNSEKGILDGAEHFLTTTVQAMNTFERNFGPYPYSRLLVVQGDFPDGMEFSGLAFISTAWFYYYDGNFTNYLSLINVHEVAHQWWYAQVGNDSALSPWLDEALSTYSEYIFVEENYPQLRDWWWAFRIAPYNPAGKVDSTVYEFDNIRQYINAVYLRGVQMLQRIRDRIGDKAFFDWLKLYLEAGQGRIVSADTFWAVMPPEQYQKIEDIRAEFLNEDE